MTSMKRITADIRGNTAILFSLAAIPLTLGAGAAVDYVSALNARTVVQAAADAAAMAGATSGKTNAKALQKIVDEYITANGVEAKTNVKSINPKLDAAKSTFSVMIETKVETNFMFLAGINEMDANAYAEVALGGGALELVLALDNTESMNYGGRLPALKVAAKSLIDTVLAGSSSANHVKVGIVPFANYVNIGTKYRNETWIDVEADSTSNVCWDTYPDATNSNCRMETYTAYNDGVPNEVTTEVCDWDWGAPTQHCGPKNFTWNGCVGSRSHPDDSKIVGLGNKYPGIVKDRSGTYEVACPQEITDLSDEADMLKGKIDSMVGTQNTYIAPGVLWGWNMLNSAAPLTSAKTKAWMKAKKGTKALVVMTDGENTLSASYPHHENSDPDEANKVTAETCKQAKKDGIVVYTVAFMVTNAKALQMLGDCASDTTKAFTADDPGALTTAFNDIANSLMSFRLTK